MRPAPLPGGSGPRARAGVVTIPELILVLWLFGLLTTAMASFSIGLGRLSAAQRDRVRTQELVRTTRVVLRAELRHGLPAQVLAGGGDSLRVRAARGAGVVCLIDGADLLVAYRGVRQPEPDKDSVLLVGPEGIITADAIRSAAPSDRCGGSLRIRSGPGADGLDGDAGTIAVVFEGGVYQVADGALRYRRGAGGRQPLTEALLDRRSRLGLLRDRVVVALSIRSDSLRSAGPAPVRSAVPLLNAEDAP